MLGHLMEWFYSGIGGIRQKENALAFKQIRIHPEFVEGITHAETNYASPYGLIKTAWKKEGTAINLNVDIPANTTATIELPSSRNQEIREGNKPFRGLTSNGYAKGRTLLHVGSGNYRFTVQ